jgi:hypothetical protein
MGIVASEKVIPKVNQLASTRQIDFVWHVGDIRSEFIHSTPLFSSQHKKISLHPK